MGEFKISSKMYSLVQRFNNTLFEQEVISKDFLYQVVRNERNLIQHIYSSGDIKFAAALIKLGASFYVGAASCNAKV